MKFEPQKNTPKFIDGRVIGDNGIDLTDLLKRTENSSFIYFSTEKGIVIRVNKQHGPYPSVVGRLG